MLIDSRTTFENVDRVGINLICSQYSKSSHSETGTRIRVEPLKHTLS